MKLPERNYEIDFEIRRREYKGKRTPNLIKEVIGIMLFSKLEIPLTNGNVESDYASRPLYEFQTQHFEMFTSIPTTALCEWRKRILKAREKNKQT